MFNRLCGKFCDQQSSNVGEIVISGIKVEQSAPLQQLQVSNIRSVRDIYTRLRGNKNWLRQQQAYVVDNSNSLFYGAIKNNKPHGFGRLCGEDGSLFQGNFDEGVGEGANCFYIYPDGSYYQGNIKNSRAQGEGKFVFRDQVLVYEGNWSGDLPHGYGIEKLSDQSRYEGDFVKGIKQGQGTFFWENGDRYDGQFKEGMMSGQGVFESVKDGYKYTGFFQRNLKNGAGVEQFRDGTIIKCNFEEDTRIGSITVTKDGIEEKGIETQGKFIRI